MVTEQQHSALCSSLDEYINYLHGYRFATKELQEEGTLLLKHTEAIRAELGSVDLKSSKASVIVYGLVTSITRYFSEFNWYSDMAFYTQSQSYFGVMLNLARL